MSDAATAVSVRNAGSVFRTDGQGGGGRRRGREREIEEGRRGGKSSGGEIAGLQFPQLHCHPKRCCKHLVCNPYIMDPAFRGKAF